MAGSDSDDNSVNEGEQIRVSFVLDPSVQDRSLEVPSEPIAVPSDVRRRGLSAVINHLLDRRVDSEDSDDGDASDSDDEDKLPPIPFDFLIEQKLLRTGVETAARRYGLSLEQAVRIIYFPAQTAPESQGESEELPDWISAMSYYDHDSKPWLCTGGYDGSIRVHRASKDKKSVKTVSAAHAHEGPIKCLSVRTDDGNKLLIASGSLDQTLATHILDTKTNKLTAHAKYINGHTASIGCVDLLNNSAGLMASGDWDGGICVWDPNAAAESTPELSEEPSKKRKTGSKKSKSSGQEEQMNVVPKVVLKAHVSQVSGVSWGNDPQSSAAGTTLITGSWDNSVKVWDIERQDCLLTLNGSRVVSCLDTSYHSQGVVATGHPDCTVRLWDVRTSKGNAEGSAAVVSDSTLKPSHKAWVSAVQWSLTDPYVWASTSHDGTIKMWDIRSSLPLYTVRAHPKEEKALCLAYGNGVIYTGGSDCVVKQYIC